MTKFYVPDMSCGHCIAAITAAIQAVEHSADVQCDLESHTVSISGVGNAKQRAAVLEDAGYPAKQIA